MTFDEYADKYATVANLFELSWHDGPTADIDLDFLPRVVSPQSRAFALAVFEVLEIEMEDHDG